MSNIERTYGNTSNMENTMRRKYTYNDYIVPTKMDIVPIDCVTCTKHLTNRVPNEPRCQLICGDNAIVQSKNKRAYSSQKERLKLKNEQMQRIIASRGLRARRTPDYRIKKLTLNNLEKLLGRLPKLFELI